MPHCPYCKTEVIEVRSRPVTVTGPEDSWRGISYFCPSCESLLSVSIDPMSLKADIVEAIYHAQEKSRKD